MKPGALSSNWKKLQKSSGRPPTSKQKQPLPSKKRKAGSYASSIQEPATKHMKMSLTPHPNSNGSTARSTSSATKSPTAGKYLALDCEMVGTTDVTPLAVHAHNREANITKTPEYSIVARVSFVNYNGDTIYDAYVLPPPGVRVSDYRSRWSGISPKDLVPGNPDTKPRTFDKMQKEVDALMQGRILVGHALKNDMAVLGLTHPKWDIRDTSRYPKYREMAAVAGRNGKMGKARTPSLKRLASEVLGLEIQTGSGHNSVEDARSAMLLFRREKMGFEQEAVKAYGRRPMQTARNGAGKVELHQEGESNGNDKINGTVDDESELDEDEIAALLSDEDGSTKENGSIEAINGTAAPKKRKKKKKKSRTKR